MYQIGTLFTDNRTNKIYRIVDSIFQGAEYLHRVQDIITKDYKRHYASKLDNIAEIIGYIDRANEANLIGASGISVKYKINAKYYNKLKRSKTSSIQSLIAKLDSTFITGYKPPIELNRPSYSIAKRASKGYIDFSLTYTADYNSIRQLKKQDYFTDCNELRPFSEMPQNETAKIDEVVTHYDTTNVVFVDFSTKTIIDYKQWTLLTKIA